MHTDKMVYIYQENKCDTVGRWYMAPAMSGATVGYMLWRIIVTLSMQQVLSLQTYKQGENIGTKPILRKYGEKRLTWCGHSRVWFGFQTWILWVLECLLKAEMHQAECKNVAACGKLWLRHYKWKHYSCSHEVYSHTNLLSGSRCPPLRGEPPCAANGCEPHLGHQSWAQGAWGGTRRLR